MKGWIKGLLIGVGVVALGFLGYAATQPGAYDVERTIEIDASGEVVHGIVADLHTWKDWTAWTSERDPEAEWTYEGDVGMVGHGMEWDGPELGWGRLKLTGVSPAAIDYDLWFQEGSAPAQGGFTFAEADSTTTVTWKDAGDVPFVLRPMVGTLEKMLTKDFDEGLSGLKEAAEAKQAEVDEAAEQARLQAEQEAQAAAEAEGEGAEEAMETP